MAKFDKGKYIVKNREKYVGDVNNVVYRSSWEKQVMIKLDNNPNIHRWASEESVIPYISPLDNRKHKYYMDFTIWTKKPDGSVQTTWIEVKPYKETQPPVVTKGKRKTTIIREQKTWLVNSAKWSTTRAICAKKENYNFIILTEKEIFGKD